MKTALNKGSKRDYLLLDKIYYYVDKYITCGYHLVDIGCDNYELN